SFQKSPTLLSFAASAGGGPSPAQSVNLTPSIPGLAYTTSATTNWLSVTPSSGTMPQSLQVTADPSGLAAGNYSATITVSAPNASPSGYVVSVSFTATAVTPVPLLV